MKNKLLKILSAFTFAVSSLGTGLFFVKTVSAEVTGAEWATGNDKVSVTMNYDITNSNYGETGENPGYWRIRLADSNTLTSYNNALKAEDFWYKTSYMNLKPMFYETVADAENPSINLGYYEDDFKTTSTPVQSIVSNSMQACDYYGIIYTFTDLETGNYFSVKMYNTASNVPNAKIAISVNGGAYEGETNLTGSFTGRFNGTKGSAQTGVFYLLNLKYDQDENKVKFFRDLSSSFDLSTYGLDSAFETYKVDLSFDRIQAGKTAKLCVYYLNGYDLTATTDVSNLASNGTVVYQKSAAYDCAEDSKVTLTDVVGCWDTAAGDISNQLSYSVKDAQSNEVAVEEGYFTAKSGEYAVTASYGEISKTFMVDVNVPKLATAEWATGNDQVSVTMNFDVANSEYAWWAFSQYDSNLCVSNNNAALKEAGMWYKTNYLGLKPMLYTAPKLESGNPTINLGYYDGDFKMTSSPANSAQKNDASKIDFYGVEYKFTDLLTGDYFTVRAESSYNAPNAKVTVTVNGDTAKAQSSSIAFSFISRTNGGWNTTNGNLNPFSLKYDTTANAIVTNRNMSTSLSLAAAGLTEALDTYTVDMSFVTYRLDTAKLLVYSLNGYDLCGETTASLSDNEHNEVLYATTNSVETTDGTVDLKGVVKGFSSFDGDVTDALVYTVANADGESVAVNNGKFMANKSGVYTITAAHGANTTKDFTVNVTVPGVTYPAGGVIMKSVRLNLEGKIGVQFLVSADETLYGEEGGKVVFTVAGKTQEVAFTDWTKYGNDYIVECQVAAKQMTDSINVQFMDKNGDVSATTTYSVQQYAQTVLASSTDEALKELVKSMLNYGAYAQTYFDYNVENLANAGLYAEGENPVETKEDVVAASVGVENAFAEVSMKSLSLGLETEMEIYVLFALAEGISASDVTFTVGGVVLETVECAGGCYVVIKNVSAKDIDKVYTISVSYGENVATYMLSAQCYISAAYTTTSSAYNNLLKAIELYNVAANAYFA